MYTKIDATVANSMAAAILAAISAGSGPGLIRVYTGSPPATPATAITTQTLLGTLTCSDPAGSSSGGVITFGAITQDSSADAGGTAAWARLVDSDGVGVMDVDVTATGGGGAIELNTVTIVAGGPIQITAFLIAVG